MLASPAIVTGVNFWGWTYGGVTTRVDWLLEGSNNFLFIPDFGTASITSTFLFQKNGHNVTENSIAVHWFLGANTPYYLTLRNARASQDATDYVYWDANGGPSTAWMGVTRTDANLLPKSETFQILTADTPVPEPGSVALLGSGLLLLAGAVRRRMR